MNIEKFVPAERDIEDADPRYGALQKREAFFTELDGAQNIEELVSILKKYAFSLNGELVTPIFMQETEDYAQSVPHDGLWVVDTTVSLANTLDALAEYQQGHLSEQQLYNALDLEYNAMGVVRRLTGVQVDSEIQSLIFQGDLPARGGDGQTIDVDSIPKPKALE